MEKSHVMPIARQLAAHLPGEWTLGADNNWATTLKRDDGLEITLSHDDYKKRTEVTPSTPKRHGGYTSLRDWSVVPYNAPTPSASFADSRNPKAAAADVVRKVIAPYEPLLAQIRVRQAEQEAYNKKAASLVEQFTTALGEPPRDNKIDQGSEASFHPFKDSFYGMIRVSGGNVQMELRSVTPALALKIAELLGKEAKRK